MEKIEDECDLNAFDKAMASFKQDGTTYILDDLKTIYTAPDEKTGLKQLEAVTKKWEVHYPNAMKRWTMPLQGIWRAVNNVSWKAP